jgi:hypothetical protein
MSPSLVAEHEGARQPCFTKSAEEPTWITDWAVPLLAARQSLKRLDIRNTHISQEGVASLRRALRECEIISEW